MRSSKTANYNKIAAQYYAELEMACRSAGESRSMSGLRTELRAAKNCLEQISKLPSPVKEAMFVQNALAGIFSLDRAA